MSRPSNPRGVSTNEPQVNHRRQTWTGNGFHCTFETTTYSTPGFSFSSAGDAAISSPLLASRQPQSRPGGFLGTAINLIDGMLAMQMPQSQDRLSQPQARSNQSGPSAVKDRASDDRQARSAPKSRLSGQTHQATDGEAVRRSSRPTPKPQQSPGRSSRQGTRSRGVPVVDLTDEDSDDDEKLIHDLQHVVDHHRREMRNCRRRLNQASRQSTVDLAHIQSLRNKIKTHEAALEEALEDLKALKADVEKDRARRQIPPRRASPQRRDPSGVDWRDFLPPDSTFKLFPSSVPPRRASTFADHASSAEADFANFAEAASGFHRSFDAPGFTFSFGASTRPRPAAANSRSHPSGSVPKSKVSAGPTMPTPPQQRPPPTLLTPAEATSLYKVYDQRWAQLDATDPSIPYPARSLLSTGLTARDTLWSPLTSSPVSAWSEETVMQANVQAMLLGAAGLAPMYTERAGGRVQMGFDKARASDAQISTLLAMLKKERTRWHSDRLGRRNRGSDELNVELQRDEKARAVFHAVCGLMDAVQS